MTANISALPSYVGHSPVARRIVRAALACPFLASALLKILDFEAATQESVDLGLAFPEVTATAVIATQIIGSLLLLTSRWAWLGAGMLAVFTALATLLAHPFWAFDGMDRHRQLMTFLEHIALVGGLAAAAVMERVAAGGTEPSEL
jgi:transmembrane protein